jgi:hypothetical protein
MGLKGLDAKTNWLGLNRQSQSNCDSDSDSDSWLWLRKGFVCSSVEWSDMDYLIGDWEISVANCQQLSWKLACEEKARRLVWNDRKPGTQLFELSADKNSARAAVTRGHENEKLKNLPR